MRTWPGIVLAPLLALADQSVAYMLVEWGCNYQHFAALQVVHAFFLACALLTLVPAWPGAMRPRVPDAALPGDSHDRHHFMSVLSLMVGSLSALIIVALWIPQWVLSPCFA
jgi:hypothetical protein